MTLFLFPFPFPLVAQKLIPFTREFPFPCTPLLATRPHLRNNDLVRLLVSLITGLLKTDDESANDIRLCEYRRSILSVQLCGVVFLGDLAAVNQAVGCRLYNEIFHASGARNERL